MSEITAGLFSARAGYYAESKPKIILNFLSRFGGRILIRIQLAGGCFHLWAPGASEPTPGVAGKNAGFCLPRGWS